MYGYENHTELLDVPDIVARAHRIYNSINMVYLYPGYCGTGVQNVQKFRIRI